MDKTKQPDALEILKKAAASREAFIQKHPGFIAEDKRETVVSPSTTDEHSRRTARIEKRQKRVDPDAVAHDFHQRKLLGEDF